MTIPWLRRVGAAAAAPKSAAPSEISAPGPLLMMLEARAPWEYAASWAARPWLAQLPPGDGHPVVVFPGLGAPDATTRPLRNFLRARGYSPYAWNQGFNLGPRHGVLDNCRSLVRQAAQRHGRPVSLVGWSLGGLYARELAKEMPELVRCVITLGTPFAGHPRATNAWRLFEKVSGQTAHDEALLAQLRQPPSCPTTSIFSRSDGIVAWPCSLNPPLPHTENIEVSASHLGLGLNPLVQYAVVDRLAQDPRAWRPFELRGARRWFYRLATAASSSPSPSTRAKSVA